MRYFNKTFKESEGTERVVNKKGIVIGAILMICIIGTILLYKSHQSQTIQTTQTAQTEISLADTTSLKDSIFWDTYRDYPKYRLEAAERVEKLVADGMTEEEACSIAIDEITTKVFEEKCEFIQQNNDLGDGLEEAYQLYLKETQY